ncbi:hypothetical protein [Stenomitos frigidus]|uniref:hypothetical protein n=1 Tax=Stenomitos frigidus TaxID=1886765 RepID=UPI0015E6E71E|nr:hypothetical protein [Stenomitos frigidus]
MRLISAMGQVWDNNEKKLQKQNMAVVPAHSLVVVELGQQRSTRCERCLLRQGQAR